MMSAASSFDRAHAYRREAARCRRLAEGLGAADRQLMLRIAGEHERRARRVEVATRYAVPFADPVS